MRGMCALEISTLNKQAVRYTKKKIKLLRVVQKSRLSFVDFEIHK